MPPGSLIILPRALRLAEHAWRLPPRAFRLARGPAARLAAAALLAGFSPDAGALVADCEDGSVVLAQRWQDVHCSGASEVPPGGTPRLGLARTQQAPDWREARRRDEAARERDLEAQVEQARARRRHGRVLLPARELARFELSADEHRALGRFIERSQQRGAAVVARAKVSGSAGRLRIAHSGAFESRLRASLGRRGSVGSGRVLVFSLSPGDAAFDRLPVFSQRGARFRPEPSDAAELGWVVPDGETQGSPAQRLGYVVLPAGFDLGRPLALFWGDAVAAARLAP